MKMHLLSSRVVWLIALLITSVVAPEVSANYYKYPSQETISWGTQTN